jgi:hypothetical protein
MTPQEKARELIEDFNHALTVKDCAIIAAVEIFIALENERVFQSLDYWNEVKKEIKKL